MAGTVEAADDVISVDLPDPDWPMMATNSPVRISSETESSARISAVPLR
jgi:hypothetical protein